MIPSQLTGFCTDLNSNWIYRIKPIQVLNSIDINVIILTHRISNMHKMHYIDMYNL